VIRKLVIIGGVAVTLLLLAYCIPGCATRGEIKRFQAQIDSLSVTNTMQSRQIARLDSLLNENTAILRAIRAEQNTNMIGLQEEMRIVESIMRDSGFKVSSLTERIESLKDDISRTPVASESDSVESDSLEPVEIEARGDEVYNTALLDMKKGDYDLAIMGFNSYLESFPDGPRADDSKYNIAEAMMAKGEYAEAALSFVTVTKKWPGSGLVPAALFHAGRCYELMDQIELAKRYYDQIIADYSSSAEAELAKQKIIEMEE